MSDNYVTTYIEKDKIRHFIFTWKDIKNKYNNIERNNMVNAETPQTAIKVFAKSFGNLRNKTEIIKIQEVGLDENGDILDEIGDVIIPTKDED